ncbi:MAG: hypothetical protein KME20_21355 [Kaiparowitsia implicata GSE-PSE-MK54-09C]|jgi:hypothetical protein|nr:hypothetical protein [Kaiparowitsia implicata GSE-PSE-MK54-09C]
MPSAWLSQYPYGITADVGFFMAEITERNRDWVEQEDAFLPFLLCMPLFDIRIGEWSHCEWQV